VKFFFPWGCHNNVVFFIRDLFIKYKKSGPDILSLKHLKINSVQFKQHHLPWTIILYDTNYKYVKTQNIIYYSYVSG